MEGGILGAGLGPLVPVKGTLNASAYLEIVKNFMLPTLWKQFGDGPRLFNFTLVAIHNLRRAARVDQGSALQNAWLPPGMDFLCVV